MSAQPPRRDAEVVEAAGRSAVGESALRGVRWISVTRVAAELLGVGSAVALARLVPPSAFGRAAIALVMGALAAAPLFRGFGSPLVQRKDVTRADLETTFALSLAAGVLLTATAVVLGPLAFEPLFGQTTSDLLRLASLAFLFSSFSVVPQALLLRRLDFRSTSITEIAGLTVGAAVALSLASGGLDADALVIGAVAGVAASSVVAFALAPAPPPRWRAGRARALVSFGAPAGFASLLNATRANIDYLILGANLASGQVGFYARAYAMGIDYQDKLTGIMMRMAFPIYSRAGDVADMRALRLRITRLHAAVLLPLLTLFIIVAPELVPWLFGGRWRPAVLPAQILAVGGMAVALSSGTGSVILAAGRPWLMAAFNAGVLAVLAIVVLVAASYGITAVAIGVAGVRVAALLGAYRFLLQPVVDIPARRLWRDVLPAAVSSVALVAVALPLARLTDAGALAAPLSVFLSAAAGGLAYLAALRALFPAAMADVALLGQRIIRGERRRPEPAPAAQVRDSVNA